MSNSTWVPHPEQLRTISLGALDAFLTRRGWVQKPSPLDAFRYYEHPEIHIDDGQPLSYFLPASDHFADYPLRVLDFIENQAKLWELDPSAVLNELTGVALAEPIRTSIPA